MLKQILGDLKMKQIILFALREKIFLQLNPIILDKDE
jgi:hypothetical protein